MRWENKLEEIHDEFLISESNIEEKWLKTEGEISLSKVMESNWITKIFNMKSHLNEFRSHNRQWRII